MANRSGDVAHEIQETSRGIAELDLSTLCGQIVVGGFPGADLSPRYEKALREGRRGGAILFKRNLPEVSAVLSICQAIAAASPTGLPPFIGVDQEGGRVTRLPPPFLALPPMRVLGAIDDPNLTYRAACAMAQGLRAAGMNLDFAPVLDVDSNPENPVIGDRAFGSDPSTVARHGIAFAAGLAAFDVLACGKHFPGHGDTSLDSHVDLPVLFHDRARLEQIELPPFRAAAAFAIPCLMTAHVVCEALDPGVPATLSPVISGRLLRKDIGFEGVLFSDDLEMQAVAARYSIEEAAVGAVRAGCDALLICKDEDLQDRAHQALVMAAERDPGFRERCVEAVGRCLHARRSVPPRPVATSAELDAILAGSTAQAILEEIARAQATQGTA